MVEEKRFALFESTHFQSGLIIRKEAYERMKNLVVPGKECLENADKGIHCMFDVRIPDDCRVSFEAPMEEDPEDAFIKVKQEPVEVKMEPVEDN